MYQLISNDVVRVFSTMEELITYVYDQEPKKKQAGKKSKRPKHTETPAQLYTIVPVVKDAGKITVNFD